MYRKIHTHTHTHTEEYYSAMGKKENCAICKNMDGLWGNYAKWDKSDMEKQTLCDHSYMWNL